MPTCSGCCAQYYGVSDSQRQQALERTMIKGSEEWHDRRRLAGRAGGQEAHGCGLIRFRITRRIGSVTSWFRSE
jgi:hypothetical protein